MTRWFAVRTFVLAGLVLGCTRLPAAPTYLPDDGSAMEAGADDRTAPDVGDVSATPDGDAPEAEVAIDVPDADAPEADVAQLDAPEASTDAPPDAPAPTGPRLIGGFVASGSNGGRLSGGFVWGGGSSRLSGWLQ